MMRSCWTETLLVWLDVLEWLDLLLMSVVMAWCGGRMGLMFSKFLIQAPTTRA